MREPTRATTRQPRSTRHLTALVLLIVLEGGLLITAFTRGWIAAAPYHDHLFLGPHAHAAARHAHAGDDLARALASLEVVTSPATPGVDGAAAPAGRVISLRSAVAVGAEVSSFSLGAIAASLLPTPSTAGRRLVVADTCRMAGWLSAPPVPPPQPA